MILLAHGDGGLLTHQLIERHFLPSFKNELLSQLSDAAQFAVHEGKLALTTDAFVVHPLFFAGADIGKLAVCGTVNDLAVSGATPLYLTASFIIEEGLAITDLSRIIASMADTAKIAGVAIVAGDTKVVGRGQADKLFITTAGVGYIMPEADLGYQRIKPSDAVVVNGPLGNHGLSILLERGSFNFDATVVSDCAPLNLIIEKIVPRFKGIKLMRDLTRGGLATNAKEIAIQAKQDIRLEEDAIPIDDSVRGITALLGLDPFYLANEGKFLTIIASEQAGDLTHFLKHECNCPDASIIGHIASGKGDLLLKTGLGGTRRLPMLSGTPLPRIC